MAVEQNFYDQVEGGGSGVDGNYGDSNELVRNTGGGGGGGSSTVSIISGCMDKSATNYNPIATSSKNSTCRYPTKTTTPLSESRTI